MFKDYKDNVVAALFLLIVFIAWIDRFYLSYTLLKLGDSNDMVLDIYTKVSDDQAFIVFIGIVASVSVLIFLFYFIGKRLQAK